MKKRNIKVVTFMLITILALSFILFLKSMSLTKTDFYYSYNYNNNDNSIEFYKTTNKKKLINTYKCTSEECIIFSNGSSYYFSDKDSKTIISDNDKIFIYDFINNKILTDKYDDLIKIENNKEIKLYLVKSNNLYGIIDTSGKNIVPIKYEALGEIDNEELNKYNYEKDYIVAKLSNKYGIINITKDNIIVDFKYDKIEKENDLIIGYIKESQESININ